MAVVDRIAYYKNRRDEVPNQELARELAAAQDGAGIREMAENLQHKNKSIRSDCLKVLYEIGYINPELIADCTGEFLRLLGDKDNRMVWGAMIGLAAVADLRPREIWAQVDVVTQAIEHGSVITVVWGIRVLAKVAASDKRYRKKLFPVLLGYLRTCIPRDVPTHAESILCAVDRDNETEFLAQLQVRQQDMTPAQLKRARKVANALAAR